MYPGPKTHIFKDDSEVDMYQLATFRINEDVRAMPISNAQYPADHGCHRDGSNVVQTHGEPGHGIFVPFGEKVAHDWMEVLHELTVFRRQLIPSLFLFLQGSQRAPEVIRRYIPITLAIADLQYIPRPKASTHIAWVGLR